LLVAEEEFSLRTNSLFVFPSEGTPNSQQTLRLGENALAEVISYEKFSVIGERYD
jgi:hypothetical protein